MNKNMTNEVKVGIMAVGAVLVLVFFLFKMGKFDFSKKGYEIRAVFDFAGGVIKGAPVRMLGVEIGKVEAVDLEYGEAPKVILTLWIDESAELKLDSRAYVNTSGLMGGKHIELTTGSVSAPVLGPGSIISGDDPFNRVMEAFTGKGERLVLQLGEMVSSIKSLSSNVDGLVLENKEEITSILKNVEVTTENLKELSSDLKQNPWKIITKPKDWQTKI